MERIGTDLPYPVLADCLANGRAPVPSELQTVAIRLERELSGDSPSVPHEFGDEETLMRLAHATLAGSCLT